MKNRAIIIASAVILSLVLCCFAVSASGIVSDDPADGYERMEAPYEDEDIDLWFDYSFRKTFTGDTVSTGMDTFSIYMAKNEIESAQFVLYSNEDKTNMTAEITPFTNANGASVAAEIYYEMYINVPDADTTLMGWGDVNNTIIRNGEIPDPVAPLANLGTFKLNGGKSQAFLIRAKTVDDSESGWYSAELRVKNSAGECVKQATVYLYVWNFAIPEENHLQTAFFIDNNTAYGGNYKVFYDYLLENRLCGMDIPGQLTSSNGYITDPRVSAVRITHNGGGQNSSYMDGQVFADYNDIYNDMRYDEDFWNETKDKFYFYTSDEPVGGLGWTGWTVDRTVGMGAGVECFWPDPQLCVPHHEDTPYPDHYYTQPISGYSNMSIMDANQKFIDTGACTLWCPMIYGFSSNAELRYFNDGRLRDMSGFISGLYYPYGASGDFAYGTFDWEAVYGDFYDRIQSEIALKRAEGKEQYKMWAYGCGNDTSYTYCNHLIENTGIQTKLMFWQLYQNDATGYLYYGTNNWREQGDYVDSTVTGAKTTLAWRPNKSSANDGHHTYGNGVLFYGSAMGKIKGLNVIGSLRVELLRDGEEEYEMLHMLEDLRGNTEAKNLVKRISKSVNNYISAPTWTGSNAAPGMDEYDSVEYIRRAIGNEIEEAIETPCEHQWDEGSVTTPARCLTAGVETYTCTLCGDTKTELIPTLHSVGDCFRVTSTIVGSCESDGRENLVCRICGELSNRVIPAAHSDTSKYVYECKSDKIHKTYCSICGEELNTENHKMLSVHKSATCTEDGYDKTYCRICGYVTEDTVTEKTGHNMVDGVCTECGYKEEAELYQSGDANLDGKINAQDTLIIARIVAGTVEADELVYNVCDINKDGKVSVVDINILTRMIAGI